MESELLQIGERLLSAGRPLGVQNRRLEGEVIAVDPLDAERVEKVLAVASEGREEHVDGTQATEGRSGIRVRMAHRDGQIAFVDLIEGEEPLSEDLTHL